MSKVRHFASDVTINETLQEMRPEHNEDFPGIKARRHDGTGFYTATEMKRSIKLRSSRDQPQFGLVVVTTTKTNSNTTVILHIVKVFFWWRDFGT